MRKLRFIGTIVILVMLVLATALPAFASDTPRHYSAILVGAEEVPSVETAAIGKVALKVSRDGESIRFRLAAFNIHNPFAAHIHMAPAGTNGPVVALLFSGPVGSGLHNGVLSTGVITAANLTGPLAGQPLSALIDLIESGGAYVNVHTNDGIDPTNTGAGDMASGEIRGQLH